MSAHDMTIPKALRAGGALAATLCGGIALAATATQEPRFDAGVVSGLGARNIGSAKNHTVRLTANPSQVLTPMAVAAMRSAPSRSLAPR